MGGSVGDGEMVVSGVGETGGVVVGPHAPNAIANPKAVVNRMKERVMIDSPMNNNSVKVRLSIKCNHLYLFW